jgi:uncharacterized protein (TIGR03084 family)
MATIVPYGIDERKRSCVRSFRQLAPSCSRYAAAVDEDMIGDLRAEYQVLDAALTGCAEQDWQLLTPADGWTIEDSVRHLIVSDRAALLALTQDLDPLAGAGTIEPVVEQGPALLDTWRRSREQVAEAFASREDRDRIPWGGRRMAARSLLIARLMEVWAHGVDCFAALSRPVVPSPRLRHIAWLGHRTLPHAFSVAGVTPPADPAELRLEVRSPDGTEVWGFGPSGSRHRLSGPVIDWCRVSTKRLRPGDPCRLQAEGPLAGAALAYAQAFL